MWGAAVDYPSAVGSQGLAVQEEVCLSTDTLTLPRQQREKGVDAPFRTYFKVLHAKYLQIVIF